MFKLNIFKRKPVVQVFLIMYDGKMVIAEAHKTDSGWVARWINNSSEWSLLLPDGKVEGTALVIGWKPYKNWDIMKEKK